MKTALLYVAHVICCISIIVLVLLQKGKGASLGIAFGSGSSQGLFGGNSRDSTMVKVTTAFAIVFFITSLSIGYLNRNTTQLEILSQDNAEQEIIDR